MKSSPAIPFFSPMRVLGMAVNTLTELTRLKVFYFLLIFALLVIGNSAFMAELRFEEEMQMLKDVALGAMSIFTSLLAILATAMLLPKDLEDRTIYTILAKPVPRFEYLGGKLLGILFLLGIATLVMTALFLAVLWVRESTLINEAMKQAGADGVASEELDAYIAQVRESTFNENLIPGITVIFLKAALLAALTLFVSTFASSSIFGMIVSIAIYFIGHLQATARDYWLSGMDVEWWARLLLGFVALIFPDLQTFNLADDVVAGNPIPMSIFLQTAALGGMYVVVYYALACLVFSNREL